MFLLRKLIFQISLRYVLDLFRISYCQEKRQSPLMHLLFLRRKKNSFQPYEKSREIYKALDYHKFLMEVSKALLGLSASLIFSHGVSYLMS